MPQVIAVAATWVATAATAVAAAAVPTLTIGQSLAIATVANAAAHVAISTALSVAAAALTKPKVSAASGVQTDVQLNPQSPVPYVIGRTKVGGKVVYQTTTGAKNKYQLFYRVLSGGGPIEAFEAFEGNGAAISFGTDGGEGASGTYQNRLWMKRALNAGAAAYGGLRFTATGTKDTPADHGGNPPEWTTAHQASDYAMSLVAYEYDSAKFSGGPLKPGDILKGARVYDPRLDSTYPGGSGDHRWADPSDAAAFSAARATWTWSENPYLHALTWVLGRWSRTGDEPYRRVLGIGASIDMVLVDQFVEGANVADANGWTLGGEVLSSDGKWEVLMGMLQAGGGEPMRLGAKIGCFVSTPRVSIATLTRADFGDGDIAIPSSAVRRDRINRVIPRYRSEAHSWEIVPASPVLVDEYVTADGGERTREMDLPYVQDKDQAAQLAALAIVNAREFGPGNLPLKPKWMGLKPGDCVTINEPELNLSGQLVTIRSRSLDMATAARQITFMSETAEKYDYVLGRTGFAPPVPSLTASDLTPDTPIADDWAGAGVTLTDNGVSVPAIVIIGEMADPHVTALLVRYRPAGSTDWTMAPAVDVVFDEEVKVELTGLTPGTTYEVEVAFRSVRGVLSEWRALDDVVAGRFALGSVDGEALDLALARARKVELDLIAQTANARLELDRLKAQIREALDGKPLGPVIAEQRQVLADAKVVVGSNTAAILAEVLARQTAVSAEAYARTALQTSFDSFSATATSQLSSLSTTTSATAASLTALSSDYGSFKSTAESTLLTHTSDILAVASSVTSLTSTVGANKASADSSISTLTTSTSALASSLTSLNSDYTGFKSSAESSLATLSTASGTQASAITTIQSNAASLTATVSSQALTLVDVEGKLAVARFVLEAAASGGLPARLTLYSDSSGSSAVRMAAKTLWFGDGSSFDDDYDVLRTVEGSTAYVTAWGQSFGASANLRMWIGPSSVAISAMARENAYFYIAVGAPSIGGSGFPGSRDVSVEGGSFFGYTGAGISANTAATLSANIAAGPGAFFLSISGVATKDNVAPSANAIGSWRVLANGTEIASGYCTAFVSDGANGTPFSVSKKIATSLTGSVSLVLELAGGGGGGTDTATVSGDIVVQYIQSS